MLSEELNSFKESFPLKNWINKYLDNEKTIDGDLYNLTKKIANNFIDYLIFRPEIIAEWNKYEINSQNLFKNLNSDQFWQPILYKLLEKKISQKPSCLYMIEVIKNLRKIKKFNFKYQIKSTLFQIITYLNYILIFIQNFQNLLR